MKKRIIIISVVLSLLFATNVSAAKWHTYYGLNKGWYEGMKARTVRNQSSKWTVKVSDIGWGGCWCGYLSKKLKTKVKKGKQYTIKFSIKSTKFDKWVYVKIANSKNSKKCDLAKWINCKKGKTVTVNETYTSIYKCKRIYFGIGGDFGDRGAVKTDKDAKTRYSYAPTRKLDSRLRSDFAAGHKTTIKLNNFSFKKAKPLYYPSSTPKKKKKKKLIKKIVIYYY